MQQDGERPNRRSEERLPRRERRDHIWAACIAAAGSVTGAALMAAAAYFNPQQAGPGEEFCRPQASMNPVVPGVFLSSAPTRDA